MFTGAGTHRDIRGKGDAIIKLLLLAASEATFFVIVLQRGLRW
jgi:hypothetical protein